MGANPVMHGWLEQHVNDGWVTKLQCSGKLLLTWAHLGPAVALSASARARNIAPSRWQPSTSFSSDAKQNATLK